MTPTTDSVADTCRQRVTLVLPWVVLVPDNAKYGAVVQRGKARLILTARYREAKAAAGLFALGAVRGERPRFAGHVALEARIFFPDTSRERDAGNYRKLVTDSLQGVVYATDGQIKDERWIDAGVDARNPRCELTVSPLVPDGTK